jgi:hypothetical protein
VRADDRDAIVRLADTILAEQNDDWIVSRHCMGPERSLPAGKLRGQARDRITLARLDW